MIGFEFETFMLLEARANLIGSTTPVIEAKVDGKKGWHVSPDMRSPIDPDTGKLYPGLAPTEVDGRQVLPKYSGYGDMEFITQPFVEDKEGFKAISRVVRNIETATQTLETQGIARDIPLKILLDKDIKWGKHAADHVKQDDDIVVFIPNRAQMEIGKFGVHAQKAVFASIQMTAGIKLERIPYLFYQLGQPATAESKILLERYAGHATGYSQFVNALKNAQKALAASFSAISLRNNQQEYNKYLGAVAFLAHIIDAGKTAKDLEQAKYVSPMLSRTNLGYLASPYKEDEDFKTDVLKAGGRVGTDKLFPLSPKLNQITIGNWLDALIAGNDPISWGQIRLGTDPHRWDPQQVGQPGKTSVGHVFEFRALGNTPYTDWSMVAERDFELIINLNASTDQA
jgi:hypothetical protein